MHKIDESELGGEKGSYVTGGKVFRERERERQVIIYLEEIIERGGK